jgi:hypothetical protein
VLEIVLAAEIHPMATTKTSTTTKEDVAGTTTTVQVDDTEVDELKELSPSASKVSTDVLTQLQNVLPTGTFLVFQVLAPLATNNGDCHRVEKVVTGITLFILSAVCCFTCFTDSYKAENGTLYYGIVTSTGLWNPNFKHAPIANVRGRIYVGGAGKYKRQFDDFVNAALSVTALATLSLLTAPVTTCFYPNIASSILKTVPLLVGLVVSVVCAFGTNSRHGVGFAVAPHPATAPRLLKGTSAATPGSNV